MIALAGVTADSSATGRSTIQVETVSYYQTDGCTGVTDVGNADTDGTQFADEMQASPNDDGFYTTSGTWWEDLSVWDSDFMDPDLPYAPCSGYPCDDTDQFDSSALAISFYHGHGYGLTKSSYTCVTGYDCTAAKKPAGTQVGTSGYGTCAVTPWSAATFGTDSSGHYYGVCNYARTPEIVLCGSRVTQANTAGLTQMAFGENATVGAWRGAGTNGGVNLVMMHMSFGAWMFLPNTQWKTVFAGAQVFVSNMIGSGDTSDSTMWGYNVAYQYNTNPMGSIADAVMDGLGTVTDGSGSGEAGFNHMSINGGGCWAAYSASSTYTDAQDLLDESWIELTYTSSWQTSTAYSYWYTVCNYDTGTYVSTGGDLAP